MRHYRSNPDKKKKKLQFLEEDYWDQPAYLRRKDLVTINSLRKSLGMEEVGADLKPLILDPEIEEIKAMIEEEAAEPVDVYEDARGIYEMYLEHIEKMKPHVMYARKMIAATTLINGQTPVMPLAIMGTGCGEARCDECLKAFPLEGGPYNDKTAGVAWEAADGSIPNWSSYIRGHITFIQETNGTIRIYHGDISYGCGKKAEVKRAKEEKDFKGMTDFGEAHSILFPFIRDELGIEDKGACNSMLNKIFFTLFNFDPGIGVNRP